MINHITIAQLIVAVSVIYVWIFRYNSIVEQFIDFQLSSLVRNTVGVAKISLATLLIAGIWHPEMVQAASIMMGAMMLMAQYFHLKANNHSIKRLPSLILLALSVYIAVLS